MLLAPSGPVDVPGWNGDPRPLLHTARMLEPLLATGPLRGVHLALIAADRTTGEARLFLDAAHELGAVVTCLRPDHLATTDAARFACQMKLLARLYAAVECQGLPPALVLRIAAGADLPTHDGLACAGHPSAALALCLVHEMPAGIGRRRLVQAVLLASLGWMPCA